MTDRPPVRATIIGAGGLGGPIAHALATAGIELTIVDHDVVELSNLHRQIHFTANDIGNHKASVLASTLANARGLDKRWRSEDADEHTQDADLVIDASDDPATKLAVSDWAVANGRRYIIASAIRYSGNVMVGAPGFACYRCLFEDVPTDAPSCADSGVLGPVVGAIGGIAAALALGLAHDDRTNAGSLWVFDDLRAIAEPRIVRFSARRDCPACTRAPISPFHDAIRLAEGS